MTTGQEHAAPRPATPRAVASGLLFDGQVECSILEDGRKLISKRGELRALRGVGKKARGGGGEDGNLRRYLTHLPKRFADLAVEEGIQFVMADGGLARGYLPQHFVAVLRAYSEAWDEGELHTSQEPMAKRAATLLRLLAEKGIEALIDEACGMRRPAQGVYSPIGGPEVVVDVESGRALGPTGGDDRASSVRLQTEVALLRAKIDLLDPTGPGVIGKPRAERWILIPLREAARRIGSTINDFSEATFRREFKELEDRVREQIRFPATAGAGKWENLPILDLGEAVKTVNGIVERSKRSAKRAETRKPQLEIPGAA